MNNLIDAAFIGLGQMVYNQLCQLLSIIENQDPKQENPQVDELIIKKVFLDQYKTFQKKQITKKICKKKTLIDQQSQTLLSSFGQKRKEYVFNSESYKYACRRCQIRFRSSYYLSKHIQFGQSLCNETIQQNELRRNEEKKSQNIYEAISEMGQTNVQNNESQELEIDI